jgi:hypothetical protein
MEYHADRFEDFSLMVFKNKKLLAVLPANIKENKVFSHQGLSYGGLVLDKALKTNTVLECLKALLKYLDKNNIQSFILKQIPSIYCSAPADELDYFIWILKAELYRKDTLSVIHLKHKVKISKDRIKGLKRAQKHNLQVKESDDFKTFWDAILTVNLRKRYDVAPVHTYKEITKLKTKFPDCIKLYCVYYNDKIVAGTVIFESANVAHSQYISANDDRHTLGSLDMLHFHLINNVYSEKLYFDFGNSNINEGKQINEGLLAWKEGFGARTITQSFYKVDIKNYKFLETILT